MIRTLTLPLLLSLSLLVSALPDDEFQPIRIQADSALLDEKNKTTSYQGNVIMQQGSLQLHAERISLKSDGEQNIDTLTAHGKPARFQQQPALDKPVVFAEANTIRYSVADGRIELDGNAHLNQGDSRISSEHIVYLANEQVFKAEQSSDTNSKPSRVEVIIPARKKAVEPQE